VALSRMSLVFHIHSKISASATAFLSINCKPGISSGAGKQLIVEDIS